MVGFRKEAFMEKRRQDLETYFYHLMNIQAVRSNNEFQKFLAPSDKIEVELPPKVHETPSKT